MNRAIIIFIVLVLVVVICLLITFLNTSSTNENKRNNDTKLTTTRTTFVNPDNTVSQSTVTVIDGEVEPVELDNDLNIQNELNQNLYHQTMPVKMTITQPKNLKFASHDKHKKPIKDMLADWRDSNVIRSSLESREQIDEDNFGIPNYSPYLLNNELMFPKEFRESRQLIRPPWSLVEDAAYTDNYYACHRETNLFEEIIMRYGKPDVLMNVPGGFGTWFPKNRDPRSIYQRIIINDVSPSEIAVFGTVIIPVPQEKLWIFSDSISYIKYDGASNMFTVQASSLESLTIIFWIILKVLVDESFRSAKSHIIGDIGLFSSTIRSTLRSLGRKTMQHLDWENFDMLNLLKIVDKKGEIKRIPIAP